MNLKPYLEIQLSAMQSGKVWILTRRNKVVGKLNLENKDDRPPEVDDDLLKRKNIKKIFLDKKGIHCFFMAEHEIFYNQWGNPRIFPVPTSSQYKSGDGSNAQPKSFKSMDLQYV